MFSRSVKRAGIGKRENIGASLYGSIGLIDGIFSYFVECSSTTKLLMCEAIGG